MEKLIRLHCTKLFLCLIGLSLAACADKTLDEYQQEQVDQQTAKLEQVSGTYRGTVVNPDTNETIGSVEVKLSASAVPVTSADGTTTSSQAVLQGQITVYNAQVSTAPIQSATFTSPDNSANGRLVASVLIQNGSVNGAVAKVTMTLTGSINNNQLVGNLTGDNMTGSGGNIVATKDAQLPSTSQYDEEGPNTSALSNTLEFKTVPSAQQPACTGSATNPACTYSGDMKILLDAPSSSQTFLNNFITQKAVDLQLILSPTSSNTLSLNIPFNQATLDLEDGSILASGVAAEVNNSPTLFTCNKAAINAQTKGWYCTYKASYNGTTFSLLFAPVNASSAAATR